MKAIARFHSWVAESWKEDGSRRVCLSSRAPLWQACVGGAPRGYGVQLSCTKGDESPGMGVRKKRRALRTEPQGHPGKGG